MTNLTFIGGTGRCGTKITKQALSAHTQVCSLPFELRFICDPDGLIDFYTGITTCWSPFIYAKKLERLERLLWDMWQPGSVRYVGWELDKHIPHYKDLIKTLIAQLTEFAYTARWHGGENGRQKSFTSYRDKHRLAEIFGRFILDITDAVARCVKATVFVDDSTWSILFIRELIEMIPTARFIHIYRDPRDVVDSMTHQRWCPESRLKSACFYKGIMDRWYQVKQAIPEGKLFEFKLEDLIVDKNGTLGQLCDFMDIDCQAGMLDIDLREGHVGRWEAGFTMQDRETVLPLLQPYIERLGYMKGNRDGC